MTKQNRTGWMIFFAFLISAWTNFGFIIADAYDPQQDNVVSINSLDQPVGLNHYMEFIEDSSRAITYEDLNQGQYENLWRFNTERYFVGRNTTSRYWFRVHVNFETDLGSAKPFLYVPNHPSLLFDLQFWLPDQSGQIKHVLSGYLQPYDLRETNSLQYAVRLHKAHGEYTIIGSVDNIRTELPALLPLYILSDEDFSLTNQISYSVMSAFYAVLFALFLYNTCLYLSLRQPLYGFYLVFLFSAGIMCAYMDGLTARFIWPESPELDFRVSQLSNLLGIIAYLFFVWQALDRLTFSQRLLKVFKALLVFGGLLFFHHLLTDSFANIALLGQVYSGLVILFSLISILYAVVLRIPSAEFLLTAELFIIAGGTATMLLFNGMIEISNLSFWSLHLGFLGEALLMSFVVASQTNRVIEEKFAAQALALVNERKANEALEIATKAKNEFLATVSHELRTPLTSIIGFSEAIIDGKEATPLGVDYTKTILRSGKHLLTIIEDVLNLSLIDNGTVVIRKHSVQLVQAFEKIAAGQQFTAKQRGLVFKVHFERNLPISAELDEGSLFQVVNRLLENAIKFTPQGAVELKVSYLGHREARIKRLMIIVTDTGVGIPKEKLASIFLPFTQADSSDTRQYGGTGVGLFIAKSLIEKMGGTIAVDSTVDVGTKFTLEIPVENVEEKQLESLPVALCADTHHNISSHTAKAPIKKPRLRGRVLYAEDNIDNQNLVKVFVESTGAELVLADNGELALRKMEAEITQHGRPFDLVLMDLQMPIMNGRDAAQQIRRAEIAVPIIAFSASALSEIESMVDNPFDGYLAKPVDRSKLYTLLEHYLPKRAEDEIPFSGSVTLKLMERLSITYNKAEARLNYSSAVA